jgi:hypothetical protein
VVYSPKVISCFQEYIGDIAADIAPEEEFPQLPDSDNEACGERRYLGCLMLTEVHTNLSEFRLDLCDMVRGFLNVDSLTSQSASRTVPIDNQPITYKKEVIESTFGREALFPT